MPKAIHMFKIVPHVSLLQWYPLNVAHSIELLHTYVDDIESQIEKGIADYHAQRKLIHIDEGDDGENNRTVTIHRGLDDEQWDLGEVFEDYFPNLQRSSASITLYGFFEHELNNLCHLVQKVEKCQISLSDINGSGTERASIYLQRVFNIDTQRGCKEWQTIKNIQQVRNALVHTSGRLPHQDIGPQSSIRSYIDKSDFLECKGDQIKVNVGFLKYVLIAFDRYFEILNQSLHQKYKPGIPGAVS